MKTGCPTPVIPSERSDEGSRAQMTVIPSRDPSGRQASHRDDGLFSSVAGVRYIAHDGAGGRRSAVGRWAWLRPSREEPTLPRRAKPHLGGIGGGTSLVDRRS